MEKSNVSKKKNKKNVRTRPWDRWELIRELHDVVRVLRLRRGNGASVVFKKLKQGV